MLGTSRRLYYECKDCHYALTIELVEGERGETRNCEGCGGDRDHGSSDELAEARLGLHIPSAEKKGLLQMTNPQELRHARQVDDAYTIRSRGVDGTE